jgi:hypothetical protein
MESQTCCLQQSFVNILGTSSYGLRSDDFGPVDEQATGAAVISWETYHLSVEQAGSLSCALAGVIWRFWTRVRLCVMYEDGEYIEMLQDTGVHWIKCHSVM